MEPGFIEDTKNNLFSFLEIEEGQKVLSLSNAAQIKGSGYDIIILNGTFSALCRETGSSKKELLKKLFSMLSDEGRLVLSSDNRTAVKYLSGCQLEESGGFFSDIDLHRGDVSETIMSFQELKSLFLELARECGALFDFYYPYPDFRNILFVYSDERLPYAGELKHYDINFEKPRFLFFSDEDAFNRAINDGVFKEASNSFIVTASKKILSDEKKIYVKFPENRARAFRMKTEIIEKGNERFVRKTPLFPEGKTHKDNIKRSFELLSKSLSGSDKVSFCPVIDAGDGSLRFSFVQGTPLQEILTEESKNGFTEKLEKTLLSFKDLVFRNSGKKVFHAGAEFTKVFGECSFSGELEISSSGATDIDLIFENVSVNADKWTIIDYEWTFEFEIPLKFVLWRSLHYWIERKGHEEIFDRTLRLFSISPEEEEKFSKMEEHFQDYVSGGTVSFREESEKKRKRIFDFGGLVKDISRRSEITVFKDRGEGFSSEDSLVSDASLTGSDRIEIEVEEETKGIRIDPAETACSVIIDNFDFLPDTLSFGSNGRELSKGLFSFTTDDPQLYIDTRDFSGKLVLFITLTDGYGFSRAEDFKKGVQPIPAVALEGEGGRAVQFARKFSKLKSRLSKVRRYGLSTMLDIHNGKVGASSMDYRNYIEEVEPMLWDTRDIPSDIRFSVCVPVYNCPENQLRECIDSVLGQTYKNFELILSDDCSTDQKVREVLSSYEGKDNVKVIYRTENGRISRATNDAINAADGDFICFMDCDDVISRHALAEFRAYLFDHPETDFIYSDEDKLTEDGTLCHHPFFKPDWSPDTFMSMMYVNHFTAARRSIALEIGGLRPEFDGAQDYDFLMRFVEKTSDKRIGHVPKVLYHWRETAGSTAIDPEAKQYVFDATRKLKEEAFVRRGINARTVFSKETHQYRVIYEAPKDTMLSVIIPSKDNFDVLKHCIDSLLHYAFGLSFEIVIVDNGSSDETRELIGRFIEGKNIKYIYEKSDFNFSKMCNQGAHAANGDVLLFLNDDTEMRNPESLSMMLGQAMLSHTGAVGAKLLYPYSKKIQHNGIINLPIGPSHAFLQMDDNERLWFDRNRVDYDFIAVTGACLMVEKKKFEEAGGFNEELAVAYNDVELCFKLYENGYYNVVRNDAVFWHFESLSRGSDESSEKAARRISEMEKMYSLHPALKGNDPFYNPNLIENGVGFDIGAFCKGRKASIKDIRKLREGGLEIHIDDVRINERLYIKGWFSSKRPKKDNVSDAFIVLKDSAGELFSFSTKKQRRDDVDVALNNGLLTSGFATDIMLSEAKLSPGTYRIGLLVSRGGGKKLAFTEKEVNIQVQ